MEMHPLRAFLTVATERSFSRAAEKLLRTQPAVSLAIQRLEAEMLDEKRGRGGDVVGHGDGIKARGTHGVSFRSKQTYCLYV